MAVLESVDTRSDTAANWTAVNPVPVFNQMCRESDTSKIKFGDGVTAWNSLPYTAWSTAASAVTGIVAPSLMTATGTTLVTLAWSGNSTDIVLGNGSTYVLANLATVASLSAYAPTASPTFTGTVTLPTGLSGLLVGTAGVVSATTTLPYQSTISIPHTQISDWATTLSPYALTSAIPVVTTTTPLINGTATIGSTGKWADGGHIHPTDTSRQAAYTILSTLGALANAAGYLYNNGSGTLSWAAAGSGTVTSITAPALMTAGGSGTATITLAWNGASTNMVRADGSTVTQATFATAASPTFTGTVTLPVGLGGTLIATAGVVSALSGTNLVLGNGATIAQSTFQAANTQLANFAALGNPGTSGWVLSSTTAGVLSWIAAGGGGMSNPMTTTGDMIYSSSGSTPARLAVGATGTVLVGGATPSWSAIPAVTTIALGTQSIATAGATTTLTVTSPYQNVFTGTLAQTVVLPPANTGLPVGTQYEIDNSGTGLITVQTSGGATLWTIAPGACLLLQLLTITTAAGTWEYDYLADQVSSGKSLTVLHTFTLDGTDGTTMTFPSVSASLAPLASPIFTGTVSRSGTGTPATLTNLAYQAWDTIAGVFQTNIQNLSNGTSSSTDMVATADTGTDSINYIDVGINSSTYSDSGYTSGGALTGYVLANGGDLTLGTATSGKVVKIHTGGTLAANVRYTQSDTLAAFATNMQITTNTDYAISNVMALAGANTHFMKSVNSGMTAGQTYGMDFGHDLANSNAGNIGFNYVGAGNVGNFVTIGLYGANDLVKITSGTIGTVASSAVTIAGNATAKSVAQTVQSIAVSTAVAANLQNGNTVVIGSSGVPGALTAATTVTFSNPTIGSTTQLMFKQFTSSVAVTFTISGYTFYQNGKTAGVASGSAVLLAADMTLSCYYTAYITWTSSTSATVSLLKS